MSLGHREQPKISEEGIRPSSVIAKAATLTRAMKLSAQDRSQTATNKAVDGREGVSVGVLEIAEPATQEWIERRNDALDRVTLLRLVRARILSRSPMRLFLRTHRWPASNR
jgi:hypothetical protein